MDPDRTQSALSICNDFLVQLQPRFYGRKVVRFDLETKYSAFDGMLKREILYCRFDVSERTAECRLDWIGDSPRIKLDWVASSSSGFEDFRVFLVGRGHVEEGSLGFLTTGSIHKFHLTLPRFQCDLDPVEETLGRVVFSATGFVARPDREPGDLRIELEDWLRAALLSWAGGAPDVRIVDAEDSSPTELSLHVWKRFSGIDIDLSGEEDPHVFRWQESSRAERASYSALPESECLAVLVRNGIDIPGDSRLQSITELELDDDSNCIAVRFEHVLPDPEPAEPDSIVSEVPLRNGGVIVIEGDFREIHIDASDKTVIGEYRKWREVGEAASLAGPHVASAGRVGMG